MMLIADLNAKLAVHRFYVEIFNARQQYKRAHRAHLLNVKRDPHSRLVIEIEVTDAGVPVRLKLACVDYAFKHPYRALWTPVRPDPFTNALTQAVRPQLLYIDGLNVGHLDD